MRFSTRIFSQKICHFYHFPLFIGIWGVTDRVIDVIDFTYFHQKSILFPHQKSSLFVKSHTFICCKSVTLGRSLLSQGGLHTRWQKEAFQRVEGFVPGGGTLCSKAWNILFQRLEHFLPRPGTSSSNGWNIIAKMLQHQNCWQISSFGFQSGCRIWRFWYEKRQNF